MLSFFISSSSPQTPSVLHFKGRLDHASVTKKLGRFAPQCAYCSVAFLPPFKQDPKPTFDHLKPNTAQGPKTLENGVLSCEPCNTLRQSTPVLNFLQGIAGNYIYSRTADGYLVTPPRSATMASTDTVLARQRSLSSYLRRMLERRVKAEGDPKPNSWFAHALDNLLFPTWGEGLQPNSLSVQNAAWHQRATQLFCLLGKADPRFWLGRPFRVLLDRDIKAFPELYGRLGNVMTYVRQNLSAQGRQH